MARINPELLKRLMAKTGKSERQVYRLIEKVGAQQVLPPPLAAIVLAMEVGINVRRFATPQDLAEIRAARAGIPPRSATSLPAPVSRTKTVRAKNKVAKRSKLRGTSVFVVSGRNEKITRAMFSFLRALGLSPIEWSKALSLSKKGSPFIGEVLDAAFQKAVAVIVLLTPDDEARLRSEFVKTSDPPQEKNLTPQPRANVLFEAGMAFGRHPDNTVLVQLGGIRSFSDIAGRHVVHFDGSAERRKELSLKLTACGCEVDETGTDWLTEGDFSLTATK